MCTLFLKECNLVKKNAHKSSNFKFLGLNWKFFYIDKIKVFQLKTTRLKHFFIKLLKDILSSSSNNLYYFKIERKSNI